MKSLTWPLRLVILSATLIALFTLACSNAAANSLDNHGGISSFMQQTETDIWNHYASISNSQPVPWNSLKYSNERANIIRRMLTWNSPDKKGYIYLINNDGSIEAFYSIKGKVSALDSGLTPTQGCREASTYDWNCAVEELPQPDGSFGTNGNGIYFFTANGTYVEWTGHYLLTDRPVQLSQQPKIVVTVPGDQ